MRNAMENTVGTGQVKVSEVTNLDPNGGGKVGGWKFQVSSF